MDVKKAVIPAAGMGTRFLPATKAQPKEMLPIIDKPTIHYVIEELIESEIEDILIITGRGKRAIEDYFDRNIELEQHLEETGKVELLKEIRELSDMVDVHYVRQKEQHGLGHAIMCAQRHVGGEPFAVLLGDTIVQNKIPCTKQLIDLANKKNANTVAVEKVPRENIEKYGIVGGTKIDAKTLDIDSLVEKPNAEDAPSNLGMIGRYIFTPEIFDAIKSTGKGHGGEIQLTDAMGELLKTQKIYSYEFEGERYDIGDKWDYLRACIEFGRNRDDLSPRLNDYLKGLK